MESQLQPHRYLTRLSSKGSGSNMLWDGIFHSTTYVFVVVGLFILWRAAHRQHLLWSNQLLIGSLLVGWGLFNLVEGIIDHEILGVHHVNERVPFGQHVLWDMGFLVWGAAMLTGGWLLLRSGKIETVIRALDRV